MEQRELVMEGGVVGIGINLVCCQEGCCHSSHSMHPAIACTLLHSQFCTLFLGTVLGQKVKGEVYLDTYLSLRDNKQVVIYVFIYLFI